MCNMAASRAVAYHYPYTHPANAYWVIALTLVYKNTTVWAQSCGLLGKTDIQRYKVIINKYSTGVMLGYFSSPKKVSNPTWNN